MKPIYEDAYVRIINVDAADEILFEIENTFCGYRVLVDRNAVEAMAKAFGLIPTLSDTDEVLPEAIFNP